MHSFNTTDIDDIDAIFNSLPDVRDSLSDSLADFVESEEEVAVAVFAEEAFPVEYRDLIQSLPAEIQIPKDVKAIGSAVTNGDARAVLFHGPAGTGKTVSCKLLCQEIRLPIMDVINCTENLDEFVLGKFIPVEDRIVFAESFVTKAIRHGGAVVFEEINFARPQYLAFLNSLLDDNGFVRLDNGEKVRRHPNFRFFATMNLGYYGTKELNQALYNRFNVIVEMAFLAEEAIIKMLKARVPECEDKVEKILGVYHKLKKKIEAEELDLVISPRNLENWARMAKYEGYLTAAEKTIIPIAKCDRVMENAIRGILQLYNWK
jgi:midasin (ATPase involved in ribosome maturation)